MHCFQFTTEVDHEGHLSESAVLIVSEMLQGCMAHVQILNLKPGAIMGGMRFTVVNNLQTDA